MIGTQEIWKPVVGHEGRYEVSNIGRVRSLDRISARGHRIKGRMLKLKDVKGYDVARLNWGVADWRYVHQLVLEAFVSPRPEGCVDVRHLDGNRKNNKVENLKWGTHAENMRDMSRHGRCQGQDRTHCPRGHELAEWNNVAREARRGHRACLACARANAHLHYRGVQHDKVAMKKVSDSYYAKILQEAGK